MFSSFWLAVCILIIVHVTETMRSMRGMRIGSMDSSTGGNENQQNVEMVAAANAAQNEQALMAVLQNDPCWHIMNANQAARDAADLNCQRAAAAFNTRNEQERRRCRYPVQPKCRYVSANTVKRCSIKKLRPRTHIWCFLANSGSEVVPLVYCAEPLFPNVVLGNPPVPFVNVVH